VGATPPPVKQWFPADKPEKYAQTAWKVEWDIHDDKTYTSSSVLRIKRAAFMRKPGDWVTVLGPTRLAEILVAYDDGNSYLEMHDYHFPMLKARKADSGPSCIVPSEILGHYVVKEVHDDGVRWKRHDKDLISHKDIVEVRRGQILLLWATLDADNYQYVMEYGFRDDGTITLRLGATGHNGADASQAPTDIHVHVGCWRVEMNLDTPTENQVSIVGRKANPMGGATLAVQPVGRETSVAYQAEEFTRLRVLSSKKNSHRRNVGYDVIPLRRGSARCHGLNEEFTLGDFWVTSAGELPHYCIDLPAYVNAPQDALHPKKLKGKSLVLWLNAAVHHPPRSEDFGPDGNFRYDGVAMTMWGGWELQPVDLFNQSPLYP
jgi:primary-amine oxidase